MPELIHVSPRVAVLPPTHETDRPLLAAIHGTAKTLLIDAGNSPAHGTLFLRLLEAENIHPDGMVLTHHHWDHVFGLAAFDIPVVAHVNTRRRIEEMRMWSWTDAALAQRVQQRRQTAFTAANIKKEWGDARQVVLPAPTITYTHQMTIDLGGTTCMLLHTNADHADDCTVIYLPEERTLFLGDALYADTMTWS